MQCKAKTTKGIACTMPALKGGRLCYIHDPSTAPARAKSRRLGGENRHVQHFADPATVPANVTTLEEARGLLSYTLAEVIGMDNTVARARVLIALFDSFLRSIEIGEFEARLAALEAQRK